MSNHKTILVLSPHTDDGELGCGGAMARWVEEGRRVVYAAFSDCQESLPAEAEHGQLRWECREATGTLGIEELHFLDFRVRRFADRRQDVLDEMIRLREAVRPDLVLLPAAGDRHQDHEVVHAEGLRAFKGASLLGYELPWNLQRFSADYFVRLTTAQLFAKEAALACYLSQAHRPYMQGGFARSLATVRGVQCGGVFAEAFETYRLVD